MTVTARDQKRRPGSGRKPLQQINSPATPINAKTASKPKGKQEWTDKSQNRIPGVGDLDKENPNQNVNHPVINIESLDASLADELSAMRKKIERLRLDKERTGKMLNEREVMLDIQMKELQQRGEVQKMLEIEVDRLYRLKELKSYCIRVSSIRSLREKEQEKKTSEAANSQELMNASDEEESVGENVLQSPCSSSSEVVAQKQK